MPTTFAYDAAGNRIRQTDARGIITHYSYDALNRLTVIDYDAQGSANVTTGSILPICAEVIFPSLGSTQGRLTLDLPMFYEAVMLSVMKPLPGGHHDADTRGVIYDPCVKARRFIH